MMLGASQAGVAEALRQELSESQPHFLSYLRNSVPGMFPKAYRWIAEMDEIAAFAEDVPGGAGVYRGAADLYRRVSDGVSGAQDAQKDVATLREFCAATPASASRKQA